MKSITSTIAAAICAIALPAAAADMIGTHDISFPAPARGTEISATLWYPAAPGGSQGLVGDNGVFIGAAAMLDAPIADGPFPVILLSHGGFRAAPNADSWIASRLAREGYIVASVHPPSRGLKAKDAPREFRLRPADLSAMLMALDQDPMFAAALDHDRVGALGFLLGGTSTLALAGARLDIAELAAFCGNVVGNVDCAWFARNGVNLAAIDPDELARPALDPRVTSVVAIAPEFAGALSHASLSDITVATSIIAMGQDAGALAAGGTTATAFEIAKATPFDVFNECKPAGPAILRDEEGDERLCAETSRPRASIHAEIAERIVAAFNTSMPGGN
jgi:predicted dienelactone hydrolase